MWFDSKNHISITEFVNNKQLNVYFTNGVSLKMIIYFSITLSVINVIK